MGRVNNLGCAFNTVPGTNSVLSISSGFYGCLYFCDCVPCSTVHSDIPIVPRLPKGSSSGSPPPMLISLVACELKAAENDYQLVNSILTETHF